MNTRVALVEGPDRTKNLTQALELIADQVDLRERRQILIKPNLVSTTHQPAATHRDALSAVLAFVRARFDGPVVIGEGAALANTCDGFVRFGYTELADHFGARLLDLNADATVPATVYSRSLRPVTVYLSRTVVDSDFRVSISLPKTHDAVIVSLTIKNMIMGSLVNPLVAHHDLWQKLPASVHVANRLARLAARLNRAGAGTAPVGQSSKIQMHQGYPAMNLNLALLAPLVFPQLAVIDGFQAMEGNGPVFGTAVNWQIALASADALAADILTTHLMGFDYHDVGYLTYCDRQRLGTSAIESLEIKGNTSVAQVRRRFAPHPEISQQRNWQLPDGTLPLPAAPFLLRQDS